MKGGGDEIKSKQASKRDRTLQSEFKFRKPLALLCKSNPHHYGQQSTERTDAFSSCQANSANNIKLHCWRFFRKLPKKFDCGVLF